MRGSPATGFPFGPLVAACPCLEVHMKKLGMFGGTFNPMHLGHERMATAFIEEIGLDECLIIPTGDPYHKKIPHLAKAKWRLEMCSLVAKRIGESNPGVKCLVSDLEIRRTGPTYTVDTMEELAISHPDSELWILMGTDSLLYLHKWHRYKDIFKLGNVAIALREEDDDVNKMLETIGNEDQAWMESLKSSIKADDGDKTGKLRFLTSPPLPMSSTDIRNRLRAGKPVDGLLSEEVIAYIKDKGFYTNEYKETL